MKLQLYLVRGLPGSGKTSLAKKISSAEVCADYYVERIAEESGLTYNEVWQDHVKAAHAWCRTTVESWMGWQINDIVVHNVFATKKSMQFYLDLAKHYDYEVNIISVENYTQRKNTHGVDSSIIRRMAGSWEIVDPNLQHLNKE